MQALAGILAALAIAPGHAEIAFESDGRIWSMAADGSDRQVLVAPAVRGEELSQPVWSPDGTALAYVRWVGEERSQIVVRDAAGTRDLTPVRDGVVDLSPAWSPDGAAIAFARYAQMRRSFRSDIVSRTLAGGERTLVSVSLTPRFDQIGEPAWSPDGSTLAYTHTSLDRDSHFRHAVRTIPATGGFSTLLLREARSLAWSPDGARVAFASIRDRNGEDCGSDDCQWAGELYTAAADGSGLARLTRNEGDDSGPAWSPDGSRILFSSDRNRPEGDGFEVYSVAADGSCLTWVTNGTPASGSASWRPRSGTAFDPGSCEPNDRPVRIEPPAPVPLRDRLWLGPSYRGLLLSGVERRSLWYDDCGSFDPRHCPPAVGVSTEATCRYRTFRGFTENGYRIVRRRGALVGYSNEGGGIVLLSGHQATMVFAFPRRHAWLALRRLRPLDATQPSRLPPPRVPRILVQRLETTAKTYARERTIQGTAHALGIARHRVSGRLRLREALRAFGPYRFSSCVATPAFEEFLGLRVLAPPARG